MSQIVITIGRQFGSGGHELAEILSNELNIPLYDKNMINIDFKGAEKYDEKPVTETFITKTLKGTGNTNEENVAKKQFELIRNLYISGKSFIVVGRCAEYILKDTPNTLRVFVRAELSERIKRVSNKYNLEVEETKEIVLEHDKQRRQYHNYYCDTDWEDINNYDLCLNTTKLNFEKCKKIILDTIDELRD